MSHAQFCEELTALLPRMRSFARGLARDWADADDLCQTTIERALGASRQWQPGTRLDAWVYRIMRNCWIDEMRARKRKGTTIADGEDGIDIPDAGDRAIESHVELGMVGRALGRLPEGQREAVMLVMVEGFGYQEAADIIGCPIGTLTSRLLRGREALLRELGETP